MILWPWRRGAPMLLLMLLAASPGDAKVVRRSVDTDSPEQAAAAYIPTSGPWVDPPDQDTTVAFVIQLLEKIRADRDGAIEAATAPLLAAQTRQQTEHQNVHYQLSDLEEQISGNKVRITNLESFQDQLRQELAKFSTMLTQQLEPLQAQQRSWQDTMNDRLKSLESRLEVTESEWERRSLPRDCSELSTVSSSGLYSVYPGRNLSQPAVPVYCDMETAGGRWTVFQRRDEAHNQQNFYLDWAAYKNGFGDLSGEFWWGLENLWSVTAAPDRRFELRIDLYDFDGDHRYASYRDFAVSSEDDSYRLLGGHFTGGDAGDSLLQHFGHRFSTKDRDNDTGETHCARERKGGWWYHECHSSNLNGPYLSGRTPKDVYGVNWPAWRGWRYSLKKVEMKIRPRSDAY